MADAVWQLSAVEAAAAIREGRLTCRAAVEAAVARMAKANPPVNAVTLDLSDRALADADAADAAIAAGETLGALHGVPDTIKENTDQEGLSNPNGVPGLAETIAPEDSPVAANLRRAGAIVVGRSNTPEFPMNPDKRPILCGMSSSAAQS